MIKLTGKRPTDLGARDGKLKPAGKKPNCVNSQASDGYAKIAPIAFSGDAADAMGRIADIVRNTAGATVVEETPGYLYSEFQTPGLGFVDDVEFLCDTEAAVIHCRSASRLGYSDWGVNRKRIEAIRGAFNG